jgi:hypothetical protein
LNPHGVFDLGQYQIRNLVSTASDFLIASRSTRLRQTTNNLGIEMAKKAVKKATKKRTRVIYTKADVRELRAHSKARSRVKKIAKAMKRSEGSLRTEGSDAWHPSWVSPLSPCRSPLSVTRMPTNFRKTGTFQLPNRNNPLSKVRHII